MYGVDALMAVIDQVPARTARSWARLALAQILNDPDEAKVQANNAIRDGLPRSGWRACLNEGADPSLFSWDVVRLHELTAKVVAPGIHYQDGLLSQWLTEVQIAAAVGDAIALSGTEACVPTDTWFHRWLRFSLMLMHPESTQEDIVASLQDLGQDVEVFEGDPRVCDLYSFHGTIQRSFRDALSRLDDIRWGQALDALGEISSETSTWLQGARGGPLPLDALFELCFATCDSDAKKLSASNFGTRLLAPGRRGAEYYDTHAHDQLLLTRLHAASGKANEAEKAWHEACQYLVGYGQRKDITIYELLDPIETLARVDPRRTRHCLCDCQPAVERVLLHTDGSETSHAKHKWLDLIADVHPAGALSYLAREEVDRLPTFGSLHHALPKALAALEGQVDSLQLVAGWIGAGSESRSEPRAAVAACEEVVCESPEVGYALWDTVVGSLDGDGVQPLPDLCSVVAHSAHRAGVAAPVICSAAFQDDSDTSATDHPRLVSERAKHAFTPFLPVNATPLQIVHRIRRWLSSLEKGQDVDSVTNAVGWRLMEMIHAGNETSAEIIIRRIAHDMSMWDRSNLLPALAQGLVLHGAARLAALANTFAYTRVSDGWRRFAGPKAESLFLKALDLDASVAWSTVAEEVAESVARGGDYGVTVHLVELLAIGGRVSEAFAAWSAACRVVTFRLQPTGPQDNIDVIYSPDCDSPSEKLAEVMVARLNHLSIHVRRLATAAAALMVRHYPGAFSASVRLAVEYDSPPSTLITLLHIMSRFEPEPYDATRLVENGLRDAVASDLVSARVLAFRLLNRAGLHCHLPSPKSTPLLAVLPDGRVDKLVGMIGRHRIEGVEEIWPEFGRLVAGRVNAILKSDDLREQMQRTLRRVGTKREGRKQELWLPVDEEIERILQTTGAAVRSALAQDGIFDLRIEAQVGMRLLGNLDIAVRLVLSRAVRPAYIPLCSSLEVGHCVSEPITVPDGQFKGWVIIAHKETELVVGSDYEKPVVSKVSAYSGVSFCANWRDGTGLPVGFGYPEIWYSPVSASRMADLFQGPLVGLNFVRDAFGAIEVLAPHPVVPIVGRLVPTTFDRGFALSDIEGELAVVCKTWQQRFIGNQYPVDREPRITGMHILLRPDVFEMVEACAVEPARYVTVVSLDRTGATAE